MGSRPRFSCSSPPVLPTTRPSVWLCVCCDRGLSHGSAGTHHSLCRAREQTAAGWQRHDKDAGGCGQPKAALPSRHTRNVRKTLSAPPAASCLGLFDPPFPLPQSPPTRTPPPPKHTDTHPRCRSHPHGSHPQSWPETSPAAQGHSAPEDQDAAVTHAGSASAPARVNVCVRVCRCVCMRVCVHTEGKGCAVDQTQPVQCACSPCTAFLRNFLHLPLSRHSHTSTTLLGCAKPSQRNRNRKGRKDDAYCDAPHRLVHHLPHPPFLRCLQC